MSNTDFEIITLALSRVMAVDRELDAPGGDKPEVVADAVLRLARHEDMFRLIGATALSLLVNHLMVDVATERAGIHTRLVLERVRLGRKGGNNV